MAQPKEAQVPDLPRTPTGEVDFDVLFDGVTMEDLKRDGARPLHEVAPQPASHR